MVFDSLRMHRRRITRMIKRKLQDLTACCAYNVHFLHAKEHGWREFRRQYEVHEEIGRGGFGVVYGGSRIGDDRPVAIKFIEHRHVREWTLAGSHLIPSEVSHLEMCGDIPGCIQLLDWFANSKGFVVVMERPRDSIDVFDLVARYGRLDEATARTIFSQVVDTVCAMYARHGLVHRDIKDENIIINMQTGEVKLVDFGATTQCDKAFKKEFQGTRSYCPPEWFRLLQYLPLEATSWSLGVLLFILVTGQLPFKNEIQICLGSIKFPPYLTKEVCSLIKRCLSTVPSSRASLLEIRGHSWLSSHPIAAPSTASRAEDSFQACLDRTLRPKRRHSGIGREQSIEENQPLDDDVIVLSEHRFATAIPASSSGCSSSGRRGSRQSVAHSVMTRESTEYLEAAESLPPRDTSVYGLSRLNSRYDNVSASSLGDYFSLASFDPSQAGSLPSPAFENAIASSPDDEPLDDLPDSLRLKARSLSAYSLSRRRRSLLPRASFERELDTVEETATDEALPLLPSETSSPSATCAPSPQRQPSSSPSGRPFAAYYRSISPSPEPTIALTLPTPLPRCSLDLDLDRLLAAPLLEASHSRESRLRPIFMADSPPSLNIFYAHPASSSGQPPRTSLRGS